MHTKCSPMTQEPISAAYLVLPFIAVSVGIGTFGIQTVSLANGLLANNAYQSSLNSLS